MTYETFREEMLNVIENGADSQEVYDFRAWRSPYDTIEDYATFDLKQIDEVYDFVKDADEWYVDLYENFTINGIGCAEYTGYSVTSWE